MLCECKADDYLIKCMSSLNDRNRACVRFGSRVGQYFEVNIFFDRVVRLLNERATERGVKMRDENGGGRS